jgi:hypothetical protein
MINFGAMNTGTSRESKMKSTSLKKLLAYSWPFILAILIFLSTLVAAGRGGLIEQIYSQGIYPVLAGMLSSLSKLFSFSLWDIFWIVFIVSILTGLILVFFKKVRPGRFVIRLLQVIAILYSLFYILWGYNYFRPKIQDRMGWKPVAYDEAMLRSVLDTVISETNRNYISLKISDNKVVDSLIEASYRINSRTLGIKYPNGSRRPKIMIFSKLYGKMGLSGYFGPFFNEVHVNSNSLAMDYPFLLGHEKAHQFGIASEAEANLISFIICTNSHDQRLKYSGYMTLLLYFLHDASHLKDYQAYVKLIDSRVLEDLRYRKKYYQGLENVKLSNMQTAANDRYLKVNHIEKGVRNYDQVTALVISWYSNR